MMKSEENSPVAVAKRRGAVAIWFEMLFNVAIFTLFMFQSEWITAGGIGIFVLFPALALASVVATYYIGKESQSNEWEWKSATKFAMEITASAIIVVSVGIAILTAAGLIAFSELIPPAMFVAALGVKVLYNTGMFFYTWMERKVVTSQEERQSLLVSVQERAESSLAKNNDALAGYTLSIIIPTTLALGAGFALLGGNLGLAFLGMIGGGIGILYVGYRIANNYSGGSPDQTVLTSSINDETPTPSSPNFSDRSLSSAKSLNTIVYSNSDHEQSNDEETSVGVEGSNLSPPPPTPDINRFFRQPVVGRGKTNTETVQVESSFSINPS
jgi:hypothetical protein